jgi:hypothetical protein
MQQTKQLRVAELSLKQQWEIYRAPARNLKLLNCWKWNCIDVRKIGGELQGKDWEQGNFTHCAMSEVPRVITFFQIFVYTISNYILRTWGPFEPKSGSDGPPSPPTDRPWSWRRQWTWFLKNVKLFDKLSGCQFRSKVSVYGVTEVKWGGRHTHTVMKQ